MLLIDVDDVIIFVSVCRSGVESCSDCAGSVLISEHR